MSDLTRSFTYKDVAAFFAKARNPARGKPLASWARIYKVGDEYQIRIDSNIVCTVTPDNKLTFKMHPLTARMCSVTLSQALHRVLPFMWNRVATGRYEVASLAGYHQWREHNPTGHYWAYVKAAGEGSATEVFNGLEYDLTTNKFTNIRPRLQDMPVNQDNKLEWLRKLRTFKKAVKVRARMGVVESLIKQVAHERKGIHKYQWEMPDWDSDAWQELLYTSLKTEECSSDMLKAFIKSASVGYWRDTVTINDVMNTVDSVFNTYSLELRRRFGVFELEKANG